MIQDNVHLAIILRKTTFLPPFALLFVQFLLHPAHKSLRMCISNTTRVSRGTHAHFHHTSSNSFVTLDSFFFSSLLFPTKKKTTTRSFLSLSLDFCSRKRRRPAHHRIAECSDKKSTKIIAVSCRACVRGQAALLPAREITKCQCACVLGECFAPRWLFFLPRTIVYNIDRTKQKNKRQRR